MILYFADKPTFRGTVVKGISFELLANGIWKVEVSNG